MNIPGITKFLQVLILITNCNGLRSCGKWRRRKGKCLGINSTNTNPKVILRFIMSIEQIVIESITRGIKRDRVLTMPVPFALLHTELVNSGQIPTLRELSLEERSRYWNETEGTTWQRITQVQALRCFDLLTQK